MAKSKRGGMPSAATKKASLGLKVTAEIKRRIDAEAKRQGRTQSQEAEWRLELSFAKQDLLTDVLSLAYGREIAGLLMMLGDTLQRFSDYARTIELEAHFNHDAKPRDVQHEMLRELSRRTHAPDAMARLIRGLEERGLLKRGEHIDRAKRTVDLRAIERLAEYSAARTLDMLETSTEPRWATIRESLRSPA